jgi:Uma2 family endonuclease
LHPIDHARKLATWDDLAARPERDRSEVIEGVLVTPPSPLPRHARIQAGIAREIGGPFDVDGGGRGKPGGWWILSEVDVRLSRHDIVCPDGVGWRRSRLPDPWDTLPIDVIPDWICEVLSPSNPQHDRVTKRRLYAKHGVAWFWIIDPVARVLEALKLDRAKRWVEVGVYDDESPVHVAPFDAIALDLRRLFPPAK